MPRREGDVKWQPERSVTAVVAAVSAFSRIAAHISCSGVAPGGAEEIKKAERKNRDVRQRWLIPGRGSEREDGIQIE